MLNTKPNKQSQMPQSHKPAKPQTQQDHFRLPPHEMRIWRANAASQSRQMNFLRTECPASLDALRGSERAPNQCTRPHGGSRDGASLGGERTEHDLVRNRREVLGPWIHRRRAVERERERSVALSVVGQRHVRT